VTKAKSYTISKQVVWDAYKRVKANRGAAGVDGESLMAFEKDLKNNLYKLWNRMSSGSYLPPPVRLVEIPKDNTGKTRPLGIPTVSDRIAQTVVKMYLEPQVEPYFHKDSYGYRPSKSALDAVGITRQRCWRQDWVIDLDIRGFFDNLDHGLVMKAVRHHTQLPWILLYVERWLKAPIQREDGSQQQRTKGSPQGSVISPFWRICSCIMRSTNGCGVITRISSLRDTPTMRSSMRKAFRRLNMYWRPFENGSGSVVWNSILRRPE
jgi:RNA-directed DNA polymerase